MHSDATSRRHVVVLLMVFAVVLANVTGLGSVFDYPDILQKSADEILVQFRADEGAIVALFITLALSAALLAPIEQYVLVTVVLLDRVAADRHRLAGEELAHGGIAGRPRRRTP